MQQTQKNPILQKLIDQANDMKANKDSYCDGQDKAWADLDTRTW